jgi:hypothetical protein
MRKMFFNKILSAVLSVAMLILTSSTWEAEATYISGSSGNEVKSVIESFFSEYEEKIDTENTLSSSLEQHFVQKKSKETELNLALIDMMLYRHIINSQNHYSGEKIKELNKVISFNYSTIDVKGQTAKADVIVYKTFNYNICPDVESATLDEYSVELKNENGKWKINVVNNFIPKDILVSLESQDLDFSSVASIKNYKNSIVDIIKDYNSDNSQSTKIPITQLRATTYNASGAVTYANTYALSPNPNYFNNESGGGDCTNFASQVMNVGGGIPEHFGNHGYNNCWFYTSSSNRSTSWAGAQYLYDYMHSSVSKINYSNSNWGSVSSGDLIQVGSTTSIGHSMIVTGIVGSSSGRSDLLVTYRSTKNNHKKNLLLSSRGNETRQYIHIIGGK